MNAGEVSGDYWQVIHDSVETKFIFMRNGQFICVPIKNWNGDCYFMASNVISFFRERTQADKERMAPEIPADYRKMET